MKAHFFVSPSSPDFDLLPRNVRKHIRETLVLKRKPQPKAERTSIDLDVAPYINDADYFCTNNVDPDFDLDGSMEFGDSTEADDLHGLTIVEPGYGNTRRWLKGYNIL